MEGVDGTHKIALSLWNKLRRGMSKAVKQSVDRRSGVKDKTLGTLKALKGGHDRRVSLIRSQINDVKPFHTTNMPDQKPPFQIVK